MIAGGSGSGKDKKEHTKRPHHGDSERSKSSKRSAKAAAAAAARPLLVAVPPGILHIAKRMQRWREAVVREALAVELAWPRELRGRAPDVTLVDDDAFDKALAAGAARAPAAKAGAAAGAAAGSGGSSGGGSGGGGGFELPVKWLQEALLGGDAKAALQRSALAAAVEQYAAAAAAAAAAAHGDGAGDGTSSSGSEVDEAGAGIDAAARAEFEANIARQRKPRNDGPRPVLRQSHRGSTSTLLQRAWLRSGPASAAAATTSAQPPAAAAAAAATTSAPSAPAAAAAPAPEAEGARPRGRFRVVAWNKLATQDDAKWWRAERYRAWAHRGPQVLRHLEAWDADIIMLQVMGVGRERCFGCGLHLLR